METATVTVTICPPAIAYGLRPLDARQTFALVRAKREAERKAAKVAGK